MSIMIIDPQLTGALLSSILSPFRVGTIGLEVVSKPHFIRLRWAKAQLVRQSTLADCKPLQNVLLIRQSTLAECAFSSVCVLPLSLI